MMIYIILAAGLGKRLRPLTYEYPKCLFNIGVNKNYTLIQRMIDNIKKYDQNAEIYTVVGFMHEKIETTVTGTNFIYNPFFADTNSVASLWFVRYLFDQNKDITIINGDIITDENLIKDIVCKSFDYSFVLLDSSIKSDGDYNVQIQNDNVLVMSKELKDYYGEYCGISKIDKNTVGLFKNEINRMVENGYYNEWYETVLVQLIINNNLILKYKDVCDYEWTEIDEIDDILKAKTIQHNTELKEKNFMNTGRNK